MKYPLSIAVGLLLFVISLTGCSKQGLAKPNECIAPRSINNAVVDNSTPGTLVVSWEEPATSGQETVYVRARFYDPYQKKEREIFSKVYDTSLVITDTYAAAGTYKIELTPLSPTLNEGVTTVVEATSQRRPIVESHYVIREVPLTFDMVKTNAQEPTEGPIAFAIDRDPGTMFHTAWSVTIDAAHNFQFDLKRKVETVRISLQP